MTSSQSPRSASSERAPRESSSPPNLQDTVNASSCWKGAGQNSRTTPKHSTTALQSGIAMRASTLVGTAPTAVQQLAGAGSFLNWIARTWLPPPWVPGSGWPFSKGELDPFYRRALRLEGMAGVETDDEKVWRRLGSAPPDVGEHLRQYFTRWAPEPNFARLHEATLERSANLMVYLHANAVELVLDAAGVRVRAVKCRTLAGKETEFRAGSFVLCMGGIETVRFLLQPYRNPWSSHPLLGRHFQGPSCDGLRFDSCPRREKVPVLLLQRACRRLEVSPAAETHCGGSTQGKTA